MNNIDNIHKTCVRCDISKPGSEFNASKNTKDKKQVWCAACMREYALDKYNKNKDKSNARRREHYKKQKQMKTASSQCFKEEAEILCL